MHLQSNQTTSTAVYAHRPEGRLDADEVQQQTWLCMSGSKRELDVHEYLCDFVKLQF